MTTRNPRGVAAWAALLLLTLCSLVPAAAREQPRQADLLVAGGTLVTMDAGRTVIDDGAVAVRDGRIVAVGPAAEIAGAWQADETIRLDGRDLLLPGLVNGHGHAAMVLLRGVADDLALMDWLQNFIFPAEAETVDEEFVRIGTRLAALEMIRTGTTTFADMYYFEAAAAEEVAAAGLRGLLGHTVIGFPAPDYASPEESLAAAGSFLRRWADHPRITPALAPHAPYTVEPEDLAATAALARQHDAPILIHLAETRDEVDQVRERFGTTPAGHLEDLGFLGPDVVAAHGIWLDDADIELLAARGVGVVHNPESNMKLASGTIRLPELHAAGVAVGLGTDGAASNNDLDLFDAMTVAALLQKHARADPTALPAGTALAMATIDGARALGMADEIGSLEVGKRADLIVVDGEHPSLVPRFDPASHLTYATHGEAVRATVVDGRVLYLDGQYRTLDPERIVADARRIAGRIRDAVGLDPLPAGTPDAAGAAAGRARW